MWCKEGYFQAIPLGTKKKIMKRNSSPHPKVSIHDYLCLLILVSTLKLMIHKPFLLCLCQVEEDSPAYQLLAENNSLDIELYESIQDLFEQQKKVIESYKMSSDVAADAKYLAAQKMYG